MAHNDYLQYCMNRQQINHCMTCSVSGKKVCLFHLVASQLSKACEWTKPPATEQAQRKHVECWFLH